jgi:hypothetical protein
LGGFQNPSNITNLTFTDGDLNTAQIQQLLINGMGD